MKAIILKGRVCSIPYHRRTTRGHLTQFKVRSSGRWVSVVIFDNVRVNPGDEIVLKGEFRCHLYWTRESCEKVVEFVANEVIRPTI